MPQILKKESHPFDAEIALAEMRNAELLFTLHLKRCDSAEVAARMTTVFKNLAEKFEQKKLALEKKV